MRSATMCVLWGLFTFMAVSGSLAAQQETPAAPAAKSLQAPATSSVKEPAAATPAAPGQQAAPVDSASGDDAAAQAAAAKVPVDLSSIPKVDVSEPITTAGGSTSVGDVSHSSSKTKTSDTKVVPLTDFSPVWPADKPHTDNQVLIDVVTDSTIDTIKTNQIPFIQSLAEALSIDTSQIYWYNLTQSDLNTAWFLIDTDSADAKEAVLASLANTDNTAKFYQNAAAYTLNILNGPEVAPDQLNLATDVISTPDNYTSYNGDTGLISNNATAAGSAAGMVGEGGSVGWIVLAVSLLAALI